MIKTYAVRCMCTSVVLECDNCSVWKVSRCLFPAPLFVGVPVREGSLSEMLECAVRLARMSAVARSSRSMCISMSLGAVPTTPPLPLPPLALEAAPRGGVWRAEAARPSRSMYSLLLAGSPGDWHRAGE